MKLKHLFYAAAVSTLAAACSEADELSSGIRSEKTLDAIHSGTDRFATRVNLNSEWESGDAIGVYMLDAGTGNIRNSAMNIQYNADVAETSTETNFVTNRAISWHIIPILPVRKGKWMPVQVYTR